MFGWIPKTSLHVARKGRWRSYFIMRVNFDTLGVVVVYYIRIAYTSSGAAVVPGG